MPFVLRRVPAAGVSLPLPLWRLALAQKKTARSEPSSAKKAAAGAAKPAPAARENPRAQMSSLVTKLMELADAGMGLGINVVTLLNSYARTQMSGGAVPEGAYAAPPPAAAPQTQAPDPARSYCIVNRAPLYPGGQAHVPFSINNDAPDAPELLRLAAGGFAGATHGFPLADAAFAVEPAERQIGPVDFDRFVLTGGIPPEAPEDTYNGWILVQGDEQMRIPVVLTVSKQA